MKIGGKIVILLMQMTCLTYVQHVGNDMSYRRVHVSIFHLSC